eukprot:snap_masked-scaffold1804_size27482-processed-gene-0.0 protein:Tk10667 transcript:snap_masked-scaffold1804_size27482-processed-gene-0.0-mRNA-1 annotation:"PREDICTED: uncharacterized protein LOC101850788"
MESKSHAIPYIISSMLAMAVSRRLQARCLQTAFLGRASLVSSSGLQTPVLRKRPLPVSISGSLVPRQSFHVTSVDQSGSDHVKLWTAERLVSLTQIPAFIVPLLLTNPVTDAIFCTLLVLHSHWAEAQFSIRSIAADETKYNYVVTSLDQDTANRVLDILANPPTTGKYAALKSRLLDTFDLSDYEKAGQILHMPHLGDDKPSALMDRMLGLLGSHEACFLFRRIFLERLPEDIRSALVHSDEQDLRKMAKAADKLWESRQSLANAIQLPSSR